MEKKSNKGLIAAGIAVGFVVCVLIGVLIGVLIINRGSSSDELVTDAFCKLNKSSSEDYYYRIPKLNIKEDWAQEINDRMYNTLYDEYQKGSILYDGTNPAAAEMGYEWAEKDSVISIVVQIKNNETGGYEFFTFNVDTEKQREITDEELIEIFGYEKNGYFEKIRESVKGIYQKEISEMPPTDYVYDSLLDASQSSDTLENSMSFITPEGELNVIVPVFSGEEKENVLSIIDPETGDKKEYFTFEGEYKEIIPENDLAESETAATGSEDVERLELTDEDITALSEYTCNAAIGSDFELNKTTAQVVVEEHIFNAICGAIPGSYSMYFDDGVVRYSNSVYADSWEYQTESFVRDPLERISEGFEYVVVSEENIKWICENIYHTSFDSYSSSNLSYIHNGKVYLCCGMGGDIPPYAQLYSKTALSDGKTEVIMYVPEYYRCYVVYNLDVQMIDGKRCVTFYSIKTITEDAFNPDDYGDSSSDDSAKPTSADLQDLFDMASYGMADFNSNTTDTAYVINKYITSVFGIGDYGIYFHDGVVHSIYMGDNSPADPRGKFETYSKLPAENVKWMCENVYNIEFDENYISDNSYCEGGYVYTYAMIAGDGPRVSQVKTMEKMSDGRYYIVLENGWNYDNPDVIDVESEIYIIAEMKFTDGVRHWSFYDVKSKNLRAY